MLTKIGEGLFRLFAALAAIWVIVGLIWASISADGPPPISAVFILTPIVIGVPAAILLLIGWGTRRLLAGR